MEDIVQCRAFKMFNMSLVGSLFGKSPKIKYICGLCEAYNETRIPITAVKIGKPYVKCEYCNIINKIPIHIVNDL